MLESLKRIGPPRKASINAGSSPFMEASLGIPILYFQLSERKKMVKIGIR